VKGVLLIIIYIAVPAMPIAYLALAPDSPYRPELLEPVVDDDMELAPPPETVDPPAVEDDAGAEAPVQKRTPGTDYEQAGELMTIGEFMEAPPKSGEEVVVFYQKGSRNGIIGDLYRSHADGILILDSLPFAYREVVAIMVPDMVSDSELIDKSTKELYEMAVSLHESGDAAGAIAYAMSASLLHDDKEFSPKALELVIELAGPAPATAKIIRDEIGRRYPAYGR
jgi:hypothetical protein